MTTSELTTEQRARMAASLANARKINEEKRQQDLSYNKLCHAPQTSTSQKSLISFNNSNVNANSINSKKFVHKEFEVTLVMISYDRFKVCFKPFHMSIVNAIKRVSSKIFNDVDKTWSFHITDYPVVMSNLKKVFEPSIKMVISEIPQNVRTLFQNNFQATTLTDLSENDLSNLSSSISSVLFQFQRKGVSYGIRHNGRLLIADDMGLGKSVQALAIANYYQNEWPLLIVCPSSVKHAWKNQIERFLPALQDTVYVIQKSNDPMPLSRKTSVIVIISYDLMTLRQDELKKHNFYVIIFDECHMLKDLKAKRTSVAFELSKKAQRVILLSGTPALSRPSELFTQIRMIDPKIFPNWNSYTERYCAARKTKFGLDVSGRSNPEELAVVLNKIMIRRLKKDVLDDLPEKRREILFLSGDLIDEKMSALKKARESVMNYDNRKRNGLKSKRETFMEYYVLTGQAKMNAVSQHIIDTYFFEGADSKKVIVFAHHLGVLDTITMNLTKKGINHIRIDGTTSSKERFELCEQFQNDPQTCAAVLSITAAGTGITLTAASYVVFAELYWNPSTMIQAEDRAHRVGQKDSVLVQYLLARKTADMEMWQLLGDKLKVLGEVKLSDETYRNADNSEKICTSNLKITDFFDEIEKDEKPPNKLQKTDEVVFIE